MRSGAVYPLPTLPEAHLEESARVGPNETNQLELGGYRMVARAAEPGQCPMGGVRDLSSFVLCHFFERRNERLAAAISHGDRNIPAQSGELGAPHRRLVKNLLKCWFIHLSQPFKSRIHQSVSGLKLSGRSEWRFAIPWADVLTDVAAKHLRAHSTSQFFCDLTALLDREIRDAAVRIELIGPNQCSSWTRLNTSGTGSASVCSWSIGFEFDRSENDSQEKPRSLLLVDDASVLSHPAHTRVFGVYPLGNGSGIDVAAHLDVLLSKLLLQSFFNLL